MSSRPFPVLLPRPPDGLQRTPSPPPKRRRTHIACINCRTRKKKCDGERPVCDQCGSSGTVCEYEAPSGLTGRQADKRKILELQEWTSDLTGVVDMLRQGSEEESAIILKTIRRNDNIRDTVKTVNGANALLSAANPASRLAAHRQYANVHSTKSRSSRQFLTSPMEHPDYIFETQYNYAQDRYIDREIFIDLPAIASNLSRWTTVSNDNVLLNHIIMLFWTWDNVVERLMYRPMFEEDLAQADPGKGDIDDQTFCSRFLVNALLALGCYYCRERVTCSISDDLTTRGRLFADEAYRHYEKEKDHPSISRLQGEFAMFCYEGVLGTGEKSIEFLSSTFKTYTALNKVEILTQPNSGKSAVRLLKENYGRSWAMWGLYCVEWRPSLALGSRKMVSKPIIEKAWEREDFPYRKSDSVSHWWFPYPISMKTQPSRRVEAREAEVKLSAIAENIQNFISPDPDDPHSQPPTMNPRRAVELYNELAYWKFSLSGHLRIEEAVLPSVILLHCSVENLFTFLLRPFANFTKEQFGPFTPRDRCYSHATQLQSAAWTFRAYSILGHEYWLSSPITNVAFITMHDSESNPTAMETLVKACQCLHEMSEFLPIATDCMAAIHAAIKTLGIKLPDYVMRYFVADNLKFRKDGLMHRTIAMIMPDERDPFNAGTQETILQELLDHLDGLGID